MSDKRKSKRFLYLISAWCLFTLIGYSAIYLFNDSYAIDTNYSSIPNNTFTSNYYGNSKTNLIANSLGTNNNFSSSIDNFEIATNYKTSDNITPLYSMMKNLMFSTMNERFELLANNPTTVTDKGILYILSHGYNPVNKVNNIFATEKYGSVTNDTNKEYITQIALWLYLFEHKNRFTSNYCLDTGYGYTTCDFISKAGTAISIMSISDVRNIISASASIDGYKYLNYIIMLVDNANKYTSSTPSSMKGTDFSSIKYIISADSKSLVTSEIAPKASGNIENYMYYSVKINDPNNYGAYLVDVNDKKITNLSNLTGSFKLYVPLKNDISSMDLSSISVDITGFFVKEEGYTYRVTNSPDGLINDKKKQKFADILLGYISTETAKINFALKNITKISKVDAANLEELPGAKIEIIDKANNSQIASWISSNTPKYLFLENGDYKLCETTAPEGYQLSTECINFTIDGKKVTSVTMKNYKNTKVPNTFLGNNKIIYLIGSIIIIIGLSLICIITIRKKYDN